MTTKKQHPALKSAKLSKEYQQMLIKSKQTNDELLQAFNDQFEANEAKFYTVFYSREQELELVEAPDFDEYECGVTRTPNQLNDFIDKLFDGACEKENKERSAPPELNAATLKFMKSFPKNSEIDFSPILKKIK